MSSSESREVLLDRDSSVPDLSVERYQKQVQLENFREEEWLKRYADLEKLIFRGFLALPIQIGSSRLVLKSINNVEFDRVKYHLPFISNQMSYHLYFIAYSIWMIDDVNILPDRRVYLPSMVKILGSLPSHLLTRILGLLTDLNNLSVKKGALIEAYSYESISRQKWMSMKSLSPNDYRVSGVEGTEIIGLNTYQKTWISLNQMEDLKISREVEWDNAKFIGSCFNPKGVRQIETQDKARRNREKEDREYIRRGGIMENGSIKIQSESVEELMGELERSLKGEKDWHDKVVEKHEKEIKEKYEKQKREMFEMIDRNRVSNDSLESSQDVSPGKKVFSYEDAKSSLDKRRRGVIDSPAMKRRNAFLAQKGSYDRIDPSIKSDIVEIETPDIRGK